MRSKLCVTYVLPIVYLVPSSQYIELELEVHFYIELELEDHFYTELEL